MPGNLEFGTTHVENIEARQEFISKLSRGDFKSSEVVYITCIHAFVFYGSIKNNTDTYDFLVNSAEPRSVFTKSLLIFLMKVTPSFQL